MTEPLTLTEEQKSHLRELVSAHPAGLIFNDGRTKERRVFDSLAELGAVKAIAVEGGRGYCLTPEVAIAFGNSAARKGAQAEWN